MTTKKQQRTRTVVSKNEDEGGPPTVEVTTRAIRWAGGIAAAILSIGALIWYIGTWLDSHWMLATIANQRDEAHKADMKALADKNAADYKAISDKYDTQLLKLATDASRGRAWLIFSVADLKTLVLEGRVDDCKEKKKDCTKAEVAHSRAQQEADNLKRSALETSK